MLKLIDNLTKRGFKSTFWILENECSGLVKDMFSSMKINYQLVYAGTHQRNAAEHAIQTCKSHMIAGICGADPNFPLHLWDTLIE